MHANKQVVAEYLAIVDRSHGVLEGSAAVAGVARPARQRRERGPSSTGGDAAQRSLDLYGQGLSIREIAGREVWKHASAYLHLPDYTEPLQSIFLRCFSSAHVLPRESKMNIVVVLWLVVQGKSERTVCGHLIDVITPTNHEHVAQLASDFQMGPSGSVSLCLLQCLLGYIRRSADFCSAVDTLATWKVPQ